MRQLFALILGTALLAGLNACSSLRIDTDYLKNSWTQTSPAGTYPYDKISPIWTFTKDCLYIQVVGFDCVTSIYSYTVKGRTLEIEHYSYDKPFKYKILECNEQYLKLRLLSIPSRTTPIGLGPDVEIVELERIEDVEQH
jgi:hypothetical protein